MIVCEYCKREFRSLNAYYPHKCDGYVKEREELKRKKEEENNNGKYVCNGCGRHFKTLKSLWSHARFCENYKAKDKTSKYKIEENLYRCECGREFDNFQSLNGHLSHCEYHHECIGTERKKRTNEINHTMGWENKTDEEIKEIRKRQGITYSKNQKLGITKNAWKGRKETKTHKENIRNATIKLLEEQGVTIRFSNKACDFIDELNQGKGWHLQHAKNGGEVQVCGYLLDGYDEELNIAFEYDEPHHYADVYSNVLTKRDIERQNSIIEKLNCDFYRYNEKLGYFYKII